jgi:hypothetical protein
MYTQLFIPGATQEQMDFFNELQRRTTALEIAARLVEAASNFDVRGVFPSVSAPPS